MLRKTDAPPLTRGVVLRGTIFAVAIALGALAVWLIVTSTTQKRIELGILAGLWGLLLGTFSMLGSRRSMLSAVEARAAEAAPAPGGAPAGAPAAVELRANAEVERIEETLERRAWQARLEQMLRREIQDAMGREVSALRSEIASLRGELLEKVGGQLRLERIETTRVIGSDLEALQHEVRQLKAVQDAEFQADMSALAQHTVVHHSVNRPVVEPAQVRPVSRHTVEVEADIQPAQRPAQPPQAPQPAPPVRPEPVSPPVAREPVTPEPVTPEPVRPEPVRPEAVPPPEPAAAAAPEPTSGAVVAPSGAELRPEPGPAPRARHSSPLDETGPIGAPVRPAPAPAATTPTPAAPAPTPAAPAPATPTPPPAHADPFASLPRLTPFVDIDPDPAPPPSPEPAHRPAQPAHRPMAEPPTPSGYRGRRRRLEEQEADDEQSRAARHAERSAGRRHRRADEEDDEDDDLLSRLLSREGAR